MPKRKGKLRKDEWVETKFIPKEFTFKRRIRRKKKRKNIWGFP